MNHLTVKSVLNRKKKRDDWFLDDYTINPYSSCSFNCLYCYIRGSQYGSNLAQKLTVKENAIPVLEKQLAGRARRNQYGIIVLASATEPYLQIEKQLGLTRKILELILKYRFPVHVITKSDLVSRDFDLLHEINKKAIMPNDLAHHGQAAFVTFSFSTLQEPLARIMEPGATPPSLRLQTLAKTVKAGIHAGVSMMPLLPYLSDDDDALIAMFSAFRDAGAQYVFPASMTLFGNGPADSRTLVLDAIRKHYPHLLTKYEELFSHGYQVPYQYRDDLYRRSRLLCQQYGLRNTIF